MPEADADRARRCAELVVLVELEAHWENLRAGRSSTAPSTLKELQDNQRAYENFHAKLVAYNKRYSLQHIPEMLLNSPARLGPWCEKMRALFAQLNNGVPFPAHLLDKAYRLADGIAAKKARDRAARPTPESMRSAVAELDSLAAWCAGLAREPAAA